MAVVCWLVKEAMSSFSSSGAVVSVPVSVCVLVVSSIERGCSDPVALSLSPARSHSARADGLGRNARVMAALRQRISSFHLWRRGFADRCCPTRHDAMSAAYCRVRVTAGSGRPSAVQTMSIPLKHSAPLFRIPGQIQNLDLGSIPFVRSAEICFSYTISPNGKVMVTVSCHAVFRMAISRHDFF